jgi:hypothetical protein
VSEELTAAWQSALAAEQRATFGYGVLGPQLKGSDQALAVACSDAHEQLRESTAASLQAAQVTPVAPAADYPDLYPVRSAAAARALAVRLEDECAAAWRYLYLAAAQTPGPSGARTAAQAALTASAVRATKWRASVNPGAATTPFPGI